MESRLKHCEVALNSPQAVRDCLRLRIADREHEVFVCLFLNSQNRLITRIDDHTLSYSASRTGRSIRTRRWYNKGAMRHPYRLLRSQSSSRWWR
jgi:DNA repair protein RadC